MCLGVLQTLNTRYERGECKKKEQINHPNFGEAQLRRKIFNDDEQTITRKLAGRRAKSKDANGGLFLYNSGIQHLLHPFCLKKSSTRAPLSDVCTRFIDHKEHSGVI